MTDESNASSGNPVQHQHVTPVDPVPVSPDTTGGAAPTPRGVTRWVIAAVVVILLVYPAARWMMSHGEGAAAPSAAPPAAGQTDVQASFQHYQAGRYQEAVAAAKKALVADPKSADAYNNMAVAYMALHQVDDAIQAAQAAIALRPDFQLAKNNLAWFNQEKVKASVPPVSPEQAAQASALLNQSLQHYQAGRFRECMDTATQSAKLNPNSAQAFNNVGICAGNLQLWDDAIRNTQEAIRLDPNLQLAKNNLAWMLQQKLKSGAAKAQ